MMLSVSWLNFLKKRVLNEHSSQASAAGLCSIMSTCHLCFRERERLAGPYRHSFRSKWITDVIGLTQTNSADSHWSGPLVFGASPRNSSPSALVLTPPPIVLLFARPPLLAAVNWWAHLLLHLPPCSALFGLASQALGSFRLGQLRLLLEVFPIVWLRCAVPACFIFGYTEIFALSSLPRSSDFSPCKDLSLRGNCHMWQTEHCSLPRRL
jgi:hypothetical protein